MRLAYCDISNYCHDYIRKLYEEPADYISNNDQMGLRDYNNGLIIHKSGKKVTYRAYEDSYYKHIIWIFGDSRVSGMLIENGCTFASYFQKLIDGNQHKYKVINCGIPGRDIERMVRQIKGADKIQEFVSKGERGF